MREKSKVESRKSKGGGIRLATLFLFLLLNAARLGTLTFFCLAGEPVVDYSLRIKREFAAEHPWVVGYAYEVPCYIPSQRILKEGGYEAESSLIYYGIYGPLLGKCEGMIIDKFRELAGPKAR